MTRTNCPQEAAVLRAVGAGELPASLATHAAGCMTCREVAEIARRMQSLARRSSQDAALPDARLIWWKAQLCERQAKTEKTRSLQEWIAVMPGIVAPLVFATWVAWHWYPIQAEAMTMILTLVPRFTTAAYSFAALAPTLLLFAAMLLAYPLLVRD